ncbi:MAG: hypothetical protein KIT79_05605 [Deltaproteobacteria bacterium]|nr:hypothetical protein [Deltaproteobacteria bacterium]
MAGVGDTIDEVNVIEKGRRGLVEEVASWNPYQGFRSYYRVKLHGRAARTFITPEEALDYYFLNAGEFDAGEQIQGVR